MYQVDATSKVAWVLLFFETNTHVPLMTLRHDHHTFQVIFTFASSKSDGDLRIEAFLNKAFLWYCEAMKSTEDHFRYYYTPLTEGGGGANASALSEEGGGRNASPYTPPHIGRMRNPTGTQGAQRRVACTYGCWFSIGGRGVPCSGGGTPHTRTLYVRPLFHSLDAVVAAAVIVVVVVVFAPMVLFDREYPYIAANK